MTVAASPFASLPEDAYRGILRHLPAVDRKQLRQTCVALRYVLEADYWRHVVVVADTANGNDPDCAATAPQIPIAALLDPAAHARWFPSARVRGLHFRSVDVLARCDALLRTELDRTAFPSLEVVSLADPALAEGSAAHLEMAGIFESTFYASITSTWATPAPVSFVIPHTYWVLNSRNHQNLQHTVRHLCVAANSTADIRGNPIVLALDEAEHVDLVSDRAEPSIYYLKQSKNWKKLQSLSVSVSVAPDWADDSFSVSQQMFEFSSLIPKTLRQCTLVVEEYDGNNAADLCRLEDAIPSDAEKIIPQITHIKCPMNLFPLLAKDFSFHNLVNVEFSFKRGHRANFRIPESLETTPFEKIAVLELSSMILARSHAGAIIGSLYRFTNLRKFVFETHPTDGGIENEDIANPFLKAVKAEYSKSPEKISNWRLDSLLAQTGHGIIWSSRIRTMILNLVNQPMQNFSLEHSERFLTSVSYIEAILLACQSLRTLEYLQINASRGFHISPALQHLSQYHPTLKQILLAAEHQTIQDVLQQPRHANGHYLDLMYDYLPDVPYRLLAYVRCNLTGLSGAAAGSHQILKTSQVSAVIDTARRRPFYDYTRNLVLARKQRLCFPRYRFNTDFDPRAIKDDAFDGWA